MNGFDTDRIIEPCYLVGSNQESSYLNTIFGAAKINKNGYFQITTRKQGFHRKMLHRLIVEHFYKISLPSDWQVHHFNNNKLDNRITNLRILPKKTHHKLHSEEQIGKPVPMNIKFKQSISKNNTGYFRVRKHKDLSCKQGFIYQYRYYDENNVRKTIESTDIRKLEQKVKDKGLVWCEL